MTLPANKATTPFKTMDIKAALLSGGSRKRKSTSQTSKDEPKNKKLSIETSDHENEVEVLDEACGITVVLQPSEIDPTLGDCKENKDINATLENTKDRLLNPSKEDKSSNSDKKSCDTLKLDSPKTVKIVVNELSDVELLSDKSKKSDDSGCDELSTSMNVSLNTSELSVTAEENDKDHNAESQTTDGTQNKSGEKNHADAKEKVKKKRMTPAEAKKRAEEREKKQKEKLLRKQELENKKKEKQLEKEQKLKEKMLRKEREEMERKERERIKQEKKEQEEKEKLKRQQEKEEKAKLKQMQLEQKMEEKKKKEEMKLKKEEELRKAEEEKLKAKLEKEQKEKEKKERAKAAFAKFFLKGGNNNSNSITQTSEKGAFLPFQVSDDMTLAPIVPPAAQKRFDKKQLDHYLELQDGKKLYLDILKSGVYKDIRRRKKNKKLEESDVVVIDKNAQAELGLHPKLLQFHDNDTPPYWGTWRKKSKNIRPRNPFGQDITKESIQPPQPMKLFKNHSKNMPALNATSAQVSPNRGMFENHPENVPTLTTSASMHMSLEQPFQSSVMSSNELCENHSENIPVVSARSTHAYSEQLDPSSVQSNKEPSQYHSNVPGFPLKTLSIQVSRKPLFHAPEQSEMEFYQNHSDNINNLRSVTSTIVSGRQSLQSSAQSNIELSKSNHSGNSITVISSESTHASPVCTSVQSNIELHKNQSNNMSKILPKILSYGSVREKFQASSKSNVKLHRNHSDNVNELSSATSSVVSGRQLFQSSTLSNIELPKLNHSGNLISVHSSEFTHSSPLHSSQSSVQSNIELLHQSHNMTELPSKISTSVPPRQLFLVSAQSGLKQYQTHSDNIHSLSLGKSIILLQGQSPQCSTQSFIQSSKSNHSKNLSPLISMVYTHAPSNTETSDKNLSSSSTASAERKEKKLKKHPTSMCRNQLLKKKKGLLKSEMLIISECDLGKDRYNFRALRRSKRKCQREKQYKEDTIYSENESDILSGTLRRRKRKCRRKIQYNKYTMYSENEPDILVP